MFPIRSLSKGENFLWTDPRGSPFLKTIAKETLRRGIRGRESDTGEGSVLLKVLGSYDAPEKGESSMKKKKKKKVNHRKKAM